MNPNDFPLSPPWWQSCISLPDEHDKILVGREGGLLLDFERGGTGHRSFRTVIEPGIAEGISFSSQQLVDPRVPLVRTISDSDGVALLCETFCVVPPDPQFDIAPVLAREGGEEVFSGWDGPKVPRVKRRFAKDCARTAPEFCDVAWGADSQAIVYTYKTVPGSHCEVVLGFAEGEHAASGKRILSIAVDGAPSAVLDTASQFGFGIPGLLRFRATDSDGDGIIRISVRAAEQSPDKAAFLGAVWIFSNQAPSDREILGGLVRAEAFADCGTSGLRRQVMVRLDLKNTTDQPQRRSPRLNLRTVERFSLNRDGLQIGGGTRVLSSVGFADAVENDKEVYIQLPPVELEPGQSQSVILAVNRHGYDSAKMDVPAYESRRRAAVAYWESLPLPYGVIGVPDERIQSLLDSSVRNIYQARDIQNGLPAFHVGPTIYRQLWIVDGAFLLETVTTLGRKEEARSGVNYMMGFQQEDGGFQLKFRYWKESGIVLWAVIRQAILSGDKEWLRSHWPQLVRAVGFIRKLRNLEGAGVPSALEYRMAPYGDCDGGHNNTLEHEKFPDYSNSYWLLVGLKAAAEAAAWLGEKEQARQWGEEFRDYLAVFKKAAQRDMKTDVSGNPYLPIIMRGEILPQRAQWAFCHAVHPGGLFEPGDPFVVGMLKMLEAVEVEGLTYDTGWMSKGLWTYFASFLGHAQLWNGNPAAAFSALEAMADHSSPVLVWREEQKPHGEGNEEVGDMPHNWASAEFIRLALHLVVFERNNELHLFEGIPAHWIRPGSVISIKGAVTVFGPVHLRLEVMGDKIQIHLDALERECAAVVVHCSAWDPGAPPMRLSGNQAVNLNISLK